MVYYTEVLFAIFLSGGFITAVVVNPLVKKTGKTHRRVLYWL